MLATVAAGKLESIGRAITILIQVWRNPNTDRVGLRNALEMALPCIIFGIALTCSLRCLLPVKKDDKETEEMYDGFAFIMAVVSFGCSFLPDILFALALVVESVLIILFVRKWLGAPMKHSVGVLLVAVTMTIAVLAGLDLVFG